MLLALSFPPFPTRFLSLVALVPLLHYHLVYVSAIKERGYLKRGFLCGFFLGIPFFLILLHWITNLIPESSINLSWILVPAFILLVLYLSCFIGLFSMALSFLVKKLGRPALMTAPALWAIFELLRSRGELGFPWGIISNTLVIYPAAIQGFSIFGSFGMSLMVVLVNVLVTFMLFSGSRKSAIWALAFLTVLIAGYLSWGTMEIGRIDRELASAKVKCNVAIVQANVSLAIKWKPEYRDSVFSKMEMLTEEASGAGARLVIFPETAAPVSIGHSSKHRFWLKRMARESGVELYTGFIDHEMENGEWRPFNASGLFDGRGVLVDQYHKVNLVPFSERIPFDQYFSSLRKINFGQANFKPGDKMTIFDSSVGKFGTLICFEAAFTEYTRKYVRDGAEFLVNITNDGWFGGATGPMQHAEMSILRAVENRVPLLRCANTGVSMFVDQAGRVIDSIGMDLEGILLVPVNKLKERSFYNKAGQIPFSVMTVVLLSLPVIISSFRRKTGR